MKALPPGSRFGGGRSGELDGGETDSVHFLGPRAGFRRSGILPLGPRLRRGKSLKAAAFGVRLSRSQLPLLLIASGIRRSGP